MFNKASNKINGLELLSNEILNKNTAFTLEEREKLGLSGLLPDAVDTIEQQCQRVLGHLAEKNTNLERYIYLTGLLDRNETLFYKVVMSDPTRFIPILYDPTVGEACLKFDRIYRRPRGMYISLRHKGKIEKILRNWPYSDIRFICVSTGERILGLGDLGANGMGIPIGKLQLYTACAAIPPGHLLPILLDAGTNNQTLLEDPLYLGLRKKRPSEQEMDDFVDEFVFAVQKVFPDCCIHFEDWKGTDAIKYLAKYRDTVCCYNDDIQGTASIVLSGLISALKVKQQPLKDQKILLFGGGSAGIGIANLIVSALKLEGLSDKEAKERITIFDVNGLIEVSRNDLSLSQKVYAKDHRPLKDLVQTINLFKPTALIGVSTQGKAFTQEVIKSMTVLNEQPIIFALSNPTDHAECSAQEAYTWSHGKALFAAGVQFDPVKLGNQIFYPGQANNFYIFPAISLAVYVTKLKRIPDDLFIAAARATAEQISVQDRSKGLLFPEQSHILNTEIDTAIQITQLIFDQNLASINKPKEIKPWLQEQLFQPEYAIMNKMLS